MENTNEPAAYLGVECGGSRTLALLARREGEAPLRTEAGPANLRLMDDAALVEHFGAINRLTDGLTLPLGGLAIGMAGARTEFDRQRIRSAAGCVWPGVPCYATNDLETALAAGPAVGTTAKTRVLVLSGTGSCCYGQTDSDCTARFGGWGHILGDRGSGYDIGLRALRACIYCLDRDGRWPVLGQNILKALQLNEPEDLIDWSRAAAKPDIASLAITVFETAACKDKLAREILADVADVLANDGVECARKLVKEKSAVAFIMAGSVLLQQPEFARQVGLRLKRLWPNSEANLLERESVWGALALAQNHFGLGRTRLPAAAEVNTTGLHLPVSRSLSPTEQRNPRSLKLDRLSVGKAVKLMLEEESRIGAALLKERRQIERAVEWVVTTFRRGGRLFYVGAGTSGRLGILDATECPPTFRSSPEQVQGIIAGGQSAIWRSVEGAEDSSRAGAAAIQYRCINKKDMVVGIAASGRTPFVWGALAEAKKRGAKTVLLCFNPYLEIPKTIRPGLVIAPNVGPEVLTGSTRLKSGTATKIVLNTLTTLAMVRTGKVLSNLMVDLNASNQKLRERAVRIVQAVTGADAVAAQTALEKSKWIVKTACQRLR